jgi:hypothetical protein
MPFLQPWNENVPSKATKANEIANEIRIPKIALRERLSIEHNFYEDETGQENIGEHKLGSARVGIGSAPERPETACSGRVYLTVEEGSITKIEAHDDSSWQDITDASGALAKLDSFLAGNLSLSAPWDIGQQVTSPLFIGDLQGNAPTATEAEHAQIADLAHDAETLAGLTPDNFLRQYMASDELLLSKDATQSYEGNSLATKATIQIHTPGTFRLTFDFRCIDNGQHPVTALVSVNDSIVYSAATGQTSFVSKSVDLNIPTGTVLVRLQGIQDASGHTDAQIRNIRLKGSYAVIPPNTIS